MNSKKYRKSLISKYGNKCNICKRKANPTETLTIDHITRKRDGGLNTISNYQLLCRKCHNEKDNQIKK